ncbi:SGNH/GDSL hydrolase family protein [Aeromicrobium stalagmiti]|uniref:SGNH/GDSL hydrolase family protein n=1 Tax=Aeromicrobium stalagmiti TaxID=2738988 RepID=UPI00156A2750|nr:SGNH/GDSL hydrolase family protein [Aeromicrobium stalagmiti]NRQ50524.1 SGNH/GDSL hydrolase family protein [Aeromicrobium stalagmiti]
MKGSIGVALVGLVASSVLAVPALAKNDDAPPAAPRPAERTTMVVVGDSISSSYSRDGVGDKLAWWSILADRIDVEPVVLAEGGSGYLRRGVRCTGTSFLDRVNAHPEVIRTADVVIVEGGVNDRRHCLAVRSNGRGDARSSPQQVDDAVRATLARVDELARPDATVIVTVPWGNGRRISSSRWWVTNLVRSAALDHDFEYVDTATEAIRHPHRTIDGIHPNRFGNQEIAKRLFYRSSLNP